MNSIEALTKIVDELEHRIAQLEANQVNKVMLKAFIIKCIDDKMGKTPKTQFIPPTVEDILEYLNENGKQFKDGQMASDFISFYGSKGWYVGKNKMKSWKMAVSSSNWSEPFVASDKVNKVVYCPRCAHPKDKCIC